MPTVNLVNRKAAENLRRLIAYATHTENGEISCVRDAFRDYLKDTQSGVNPKDMVVLLRNIDEELQRALE